MKIWIDGDACPNVIKDILFKAAIRTQTPLTIVSNHFSKIPPSPYINRQIVQAGFDAADNKIVEQIQANELVITSDIPLANQVLEKNGKALNPRGDYYTQENIKQKLAVRDFNESLRESGMLNSKHAKLSNKEIHAFSNHLDKYLAQNK